MYLDMINGMVRHQIFKHQVHSYFLLTNLVLQVEGYVYMRMDHSRTFLDPKNYQNTSTLMEEVHMLAICATSDNLHIEPTESFHWKIKYIACNYLFGLITKNKPPSVYRELK